MNSARVLSSGAVVVDAGKLLREPHVRRDLEAIGRLYESLKAAGQDVVRVEFRRHE